MKKRNYKIVHSCYGRCFLTGLLILTLLPIPAAAKSYSYSYYSDPPLSAEAVYDWAAWMYDPATKTMTYSAPGTKACRALNPSIYGDKGWYMEAQRVVIGEGITEIGTEAFGRDYRVQTGEYAKLTEVTLPSTLKVIGDGAFDWCSSLKQVALNEGLERIGGRAFACVPLETVEIPGSVKEIGTYAFYADSYYNGDRMLKSVIFHDGLLKLEESAFAYQEQLEEVVLPDSIEDMGIAVFEGCSNLKRIKLPAQLKTLSRAMFIGCGSLETIALPESLTQIDAFAFSECSSLKRVKLPANLKILREGIFDGCKSLNTIALPKSLERIELNAFYRCSDLKQLKLPESLVQIGSDAFSYSGVRNITIPFNVEKLGTKYKNKRNYKKYVEGMFKGCKYLKKVKIKSRKLKKVYPRTFVNTPKNVVFVVPNGLKKKYTKLLRKGGLPKKVKIKEAKSR